MHERVFASSAQRTRALAHAVMLLSSGLTGCQTMFTLPPPVDSEALLRAVEASPESVTLEIYQVRMPAGQRAIVEELWQSVDEQRLDVGLRRQLVRNGFRAGVVAGPVPDVLARQLNLQDELPEVSPERQITQRSADPKVTRRVLQLNRHESATIQTSDVQSRLDILLCDRHGVAGRRFFQVQPTYAMRAATVGQRVSLRLTPELHHGEMKNRYAGSDQGIFLLTPSRERETYDHLEMGTALAAGELLIVGCLADAPGSLGHAFHAHRAAGPKEFKVVLVRLLQVPECNLLADAL